MLPELEKCSEYLKEMFEIAQSGKYASYEEWANEQQTFHDRYDKNDSYTITNFQIFISKIRHLLTPH